MKITVSSTARSKPAGYSALIQRFGLKVIPHWHQSSVTGSSALETHTVNGMTEAFYPTRYWSGDALGDHLEFALKYDGINLAILAAIFQAAPKQEIEHYVASKPRGPYVRKLWFLIALAGRDKNGVGTFAQRTERVWGRGK